MKIQPGDTIQEVVATYKKPQARQVSWGAQKVSFHSCTGGVNLSIKPGQIM